MLRTDTAWQARPAFRARHSSSGEQEVAPLLAFAVDKRYAAQATMRLARFAETQLQASPPLGTPGSHTITERRPWPTRAAPHCLLAPFCYDAIPKAPVCASLNPPSIHVRSPYQLTSASSGSRSVRMTQADSYPASQCISKVPFTRPFLLAKHSTLPCQLVPGVGTHRLIHSKFSSPGTRAFDPTLIRKNGCQPHATIASHSQRAYNPRSASTSTSHSGGTASPNALSSPSQYGRHDPGCSAGITFQATGIAHPLMTTLMAKIVHRLPSDVASITSGNCRFSLLHKRNTQPSKGAKHVDTSSSRRFFPLFCPA